MSDEQKNVDDGKRWQVDYHYNLVWEQTKKSITNLDELKKLFGYAERDYDILPSSFEKSEGPYYKIILKPKDDWTSMPDIDEKLEQNFRENVQEFNVAFLTISNDTRKNNKNGNNKVISSNLKNHVNSIKLRCQGNFYYENLKNKIIIARYSYKQNEDIDKSLYIAFPEGVIGNGQKSYRVKCQNLQKARKYGIYADQNSEYKEVVFEADKLGIYIANREVLHGMGDDGGNLSDIDLIENDEQKQYLDFSYNRIIFGAPGTGKSHKLEENSKCFANNMERVTFHPNYSYANFVGAYKPIMSKSDTYDNLDTEKRKVLAVLQDKSMSAQEKYNELYDKFKGEGLTRLPLLLGIYTDENFKTRKVDGSDTSGDNSVERNHGRAIRPYLNLNPQNKNKEISYEFVPGPFMRIYVQAINHPEEDYLLLIEEINRANVAAVFGDVFQLLDRKNGVSEYSIATSEDIKIYLLENLDCLKGKNIDELTEEVREKYFEMRIPANMYIWATMNSADQGVFPMDTAFKRRWEFEYLSVNDDEQVAAIKDYVIPMCFKDNKADYYIDWDSLRTRINNVLASEKCKVNEDKLLGPFFISKNMLDEIKDNKEQIDELEAKDEASRTDEDNKALQDMHQKEEGYIKAFESKVIMYLFEDVMKMRPENIFIGHHKKNGKMIFSEICKAFEQDGEGIFGIEDLENI